MKRNTGLSHSISLCLWRPGPVGLNPRLLIIPNKALSLSLSLSLSLCVCVCVCMCVCVGSRRLHSALAHVYGLLMYSKKKRARNEYWRPERRRPSGLGDALDAWRNPPSFTEGLNPARYLVDLF